VGTGGGACKFAGFLGAGGGGGFRAIETGTSVNGGDCGCTSSGAGLVTGYCGTEEIGV